MHSAELIFYNKCKTTFRTGGTECLASMKSVEIGKGTYINKSFSKRFLLFEKLKVRARIDFCS